MFLFLIYAIWRCLYLSKAAIVLFESFAPCSFFTLFACVAACNLCGLLATSSCWRIIARWASFASWNFWAAVFLFIGFNFLNWVLLSGRGMTALFKAGLFLALIWGSLAWSCVLLTHGALLVLFHVAWSLCFWRSACFLLACSACNFWAWAIFALCSTSLCFCSCWAILILFALSAALLACIIFSACTLFAFLFWLQQLLLFLFLLISLSLVLLLQFLFVLFL